MRWIEVARGSTTKGADRRRGARIDDEGRRIVAGFVGAAPASEERRRGEDSDGAATGLGYCGLSSSPLVVRGGGRGAAAAAEEGARRRRRGQGRVQVESLVAEKERPSRSSIEVWSVRHGAVAGDDDTADSLPFGDDFCFFFKLRHILASLLSVVQAAKEQRRRQEALSCQPHMGRRGHFAPPYKCMTPGCSMTLFVLLVSCGCGCCLCELGVFSSSLMKRQNTCHFASKKKSLFQTSAGTGGGANLRGKSLPDIALLG
ncbi:hypothetical protein EJB05_08006, partial [Eragrostis curvula]